MTAESKRPVATLRQSAREHHCASSDENAVRRILANLREGDPVDFVGDLVRRLAVRRVAPSQGALFACKRSLHLATASMEVV